MTITFRQPASSRRDPRLRASFARQMMLAEFGYRYGRAIDQGEFVDREPNQIPPTILQIGGRR